MTLPNDLDAADRRIVNELQGGFPLSPRPYADAAARLDLAEDELIARLGALLERGVLTRFGPMYHAEMLGGALVLCAMAVPQARFHEVADLVNAHHEVAHNYERAHDLNMWFVLATESPDDIATTIAAIEAETGLAVHPLPKLEEFFVGLRFEA